MSDVSFRISSALKTILGKELITDDFIAVFELVKNSFDAQARRVDIIFEKPRTQGGRIIIKDNGEGMNEADITGKWLFIAFSAKKLQQDYRDKIASNRVFAGAKGIGRFSCDRLGTTLRLYTKKKGETGPWHVLNVDWSDFEKNPEAEFQSIPAKYSTAKAIPHGLRSGTVLDIGGLRSADWDRKKLLLLRRSLERLVNPNQENDAANFQIYLDAPDEKGNDLAVKKKAKEKGETVEQWQLVNGPVRNFVFESLGLKTAQIRVEVDSKTGVIKTRLEDRGTLVYEITEKNPFKDTLRDIRIHLFALNQSAKLAFTKRMGVRALHYGSVFLYKNGFRIHPFGDPDDDNLGIDRRHQQGVYRTLGTRDLSGRVEINGPNPDFQEASSREGLTRNQAFSDLKALITDYALKRLEKFVIDLAKFGTETGELLDSKTISKPEVKARILDIVTKLTQSKEVLGLKYDPSFLNILEIRSAESVSALLGSLKRLAAEQGTSEMLREVAKAEHQLKALSEAKEEAEAAEARERERAKKAEEEARKAEAKAEEAEERARKAAAEAQEAEYRRRQLDTQNVFLKSMLSKDLEHVITLHHSIGQDALTIEQYVSNLLVLLRDGAIPRPEELRVPLDRISFVAKRIVAISRIATQANHRAAQEELTGDLVEYVREYLLNIYRGAITDPQRNAIPIRFDQPDGAQFVTTFTPIHISIIFDNLISNARKHKVRHIDVKVMDITPAALRISFSDDGMGIPKRNLPHLFRIGFTTTDGSGLGLHHVREIMTEMKGSVTVVPDRKQGAEFILTFPMRRD